jgi:HlyD family secretion protein
MSDLVLPGSRSPLADWRRPARLGYVLIGIALGGFGAWAATATLAGGIIAPGVVAVQSNRKTVQHLEGGIVSKVLVREGDEVAEGQVLFRLEPVQPNSNEQMLRQQLGQARILEARLLAERDQLPDVVVPKDLAGQKDDLVVTHAIQDQLTQFRDRKQALSAQIDVFQAKIQQIREGIRGMAIDRQSTESQLGYIKQELAAVGELRDKALVPLPRLLGLERERTRLEGSVGKLITEQAKAESTVQEARLQIQQLRNKFQDEIGVALVEVRRKVAEIQEKLAVAQDVLRRVDIRAPSAGTVQNLKVFTIGQVIRPAEALLDIVPANDQLMVEAHFSPNDIDGVYAGQAAEIRFPAFHDRTIPVIEGTLASISRDRLIDEANNKEPYFLGQVAVNRTDIPGALNERLRAGMPAELIVSTGERTMLSYLVSPLTESLRKSFTEK